MTTPERQLEVHFIEKLRGLKYEYRADMRDRAAREKNYREKFQSLKHVRLPDAALARLRDRTPSAASSQPISQRQPAF